MTTSSYDPAPTYAGGAPAQTRYGAGMATTALVLGILALLSSWTIVGGIVLGLLAIVFGVIGVRRAKVGAPGKVRAIVGAVLGVLSIIIAVFWIAVIGAFWNSDTVQCVRDANGDQVQVDNCAQELQNQVDNNSN